MSVINSKILPKPRDKQEQGFYWVIETFIDEIRNLLNGGLLFSDNFAMKMKTFTSDATPGDETEIAHGLGKTPVGYIVYGQDKEGSLYTGTTAWDSTNMYLSSSGTEVEYKILIF